MSHRMTEDVTQDDRGHHRMTETMSHRMTEDITQMTEDSGCMQKSNNSINLYVCTFYIGTFCRANMVSHTSCYTTAQLLYNNKYLYCACMSVTLVTYLHRRNNPKVTCNVIQDHQLGSRPTGTMCTNTQRLYTLI